MKNLSLLFCCCLFFLNLSAQDKPLDLNKKRLQALRTTEKPVLDGRLNEDIWQLADIATNLVQLQPNPGKAPALKSEIRVIYDNTGVYIGAMLYDNQPDSISRELSQRDNLGNTDWFMVAFDPYGGGINAFEFIVTPTDVQFDARLTPNNEDTNWDAVWANKAAITSEGWSVEIKIPYSALRFPKQDVQTWGLNFGRYINRYQEKSFWNEIDPALPGFVNQFGLLEDLRDIKSPARIQATPFLAVYGQHYNDPNGENSSARSINGGMDVKVGLSDAFTLDMTLIPDFGEARSDDQVLNLSPFEVRFDEQRAFFTEGTELFDKAGLFYSRRIGGRPFYASDVEGKLRDGEEIIENPGQGQLLNATKITGRSAKGLGVGFFNATSGRTYARVQDSEGGERQILTDPLTNYNVFVLDQNLPNNSSASIINTTVLREGDAYDANVTGAFTRLRNKANSWALSARGILSQKYYSDADTDLGHMFALGIDKTSGKLNFGVDYSIESDTYDPNDLGFLFNNNSREVSLYVEYNQFEPFGIFNNAGGGLWTGYSRLYNPNVFTEYGANAWVYGQFKNFWRLNIWGYYSPTDQYDYFEPRTEGRYWRDVPSGNFGFFMRSDSRKRLQIVLNGNFWSSQMEDRYNTWMRIRPSFRVSNRFNFNIQVARSTNRNNIGYVNDHSYETTDPISGELHQHNDIIFGLRDRQTVELSMGANYNFNAQMALNFRLRHYWSTVKYNEFRLLKEDGRLGGTSYTGDHNGDFDAFNIDLIYRWRFAPGSDIFVVWKNSLYAFDEEVNQNYFKNLNGLWRNPQTNQLSVKIVYFLDYATLRGRG